MNRTALINFSSILLALMLLFCTTASMAESINLSSLSDDEIIILLEQVQQEVVDRHIQKTAELPKGAYIAGQDIPTGTYLFTSLAKGNEWGNVTIYSNGGEGDLLEWKVVSAPKDGEEPETMTIKLNDGDQLKSDVKFSLTVSGGVVFK
ncbi:MAG: hypothetical protein Q4C54_10960 [Clostridia bacterium]|nr:hypothetical protein [Clostridia bacterium]